MTKKGPHLAHLAWRSACGLVLAGCTNQIQVLGENRPSSAPDAGSGADVAVTDTSDHDARPADAAAGDSAPTDTGASDSAPIDTGGGDSAPEDSGPLDLCQGTGSPGDPILAPDWIGGCTSDLAKHLFPFAMCGCERLAWNVGSFETSSFNSVMGTGTPTGGSVGTNDAFAHGSAPASIAGSLLAARADIESTTIAGDLRCSQAWGNAASHVKGDAYVADQITTLDGGTITVDGVLHISDSARATNVNALGGISQEPVTFREPCTCSAPFSISGIVQHYRDNNDNAAVGIGADALAGASSDVRLGCGRYYFTQVTLSGKTLTLTGRTAIAVAGDFKADKVVLLDGAELDLFVSGTLFILEQIGSPQRPAAVRAYVDGSFAELLGVSSLFLFAPSARVPLLGTLAGGVHANTIVWDGDFSASYDEAVLTLPGCQPVDKACSTCDDCVNPAPACVDGKCAACRTTDDCCPPLRCSNGQCLGSYLL